MKYATALQLALLTGWAAEHSSFHLFGVPQRLWQQRRRTSQKVIQLQDSSSPHPPEKKPSNDLLDDQRAYFAVPADRDIDGVPEAIDTAEEVTKKEPSFSPLPVKPWISDDQKEEISRFVTQVWSPIFAKEVQSGVPGETIKGAALAGATLAFLASKGLVVTSAVGLSAAYVAISQGVAGDVFRTVGGIAWDVTESAAKLISMATGKEEMAGMPKELAKKVADAVQTSQNRAVALQQVGTTSTSRSPEVEEATEAFLESQDQLARVLQEAETAIDAADAAIAQVDETLELTGDDDDAEEEARLAEAEATRLVQEEEAQAKAEEEKAQRQAKEDARIRAEEEEEEAASLKAQEEAQAKAEEEKAQRQAKEDARIRAEEEEEEAASLKAQEEAQAKAEEEKAQRQAKEDARIRAEEEDAARLKAEEEAQAKAEEEKAQHQAKEDARIRAEEEDAARLKAEEDAQAKAEQEAEDAQLRKDLAEAEEEVRLKSEKEARTKVQEETEEDDDDAEWLAAVEMAQQGLDGTIVGLKDAITDDTAKANWDAAGMLAEELRQGGVEDEDDEEELDLEALGRAARAAVEKFESQMEDIDDDEEEETEDSDLDAAANMLPEGDLEEIARAARQAVEMFEDDNEEQEESFESFEDEVVSAGTQSVRSPITRDWALLTVSVLKEELKNRGLKTYGKKSELVTMLEAYDIEQFGGDAAIEFEAEETGDELSSSDIEDDFMDLDGVDLEELAKQARAAVELAGAVDFDAEEPSDEVLMQLENEESILLDTPPATLPDMDFSSMTVLSLKDELRSRGLKVSGKKLELIARLESA